MKHTVQCTENVTVNHTSTWRIRHAS